MDFSKVLKYYINLDKREDRRIKMDATLSKSGIYAERVRGIPWQEIDMKIPRYKSMVNRTKGAIGCFESQLSCMKTALALGKDVMVMEDDLVICSDFKERIKIIEQFTNENDWDVFNFGGTVHINKPAWHVKGHTNGELKDCKCILGRDAEQTDNPRIIRTYGMWSTYAYVVNYNSLAKIINMLEGTMENSIGIDWSFISFADTIKSFAFVPGCIKQYNGQSDIGTGITEFSGFERLGAYWYQEHIEDFNPETFNWAEASKR